MTNILALPELSIPCTIRTNEDWLDAVAFTDVNGNPVALDGIGFELQCRVSASGNDADAGDVLLEATTDNGLLLLCPAGALVQPVAPGAGYAIGDVVYLAGGVCVVPAALVVTALALVGLGVAGGTGYAVGDVIRLSGGVFSAWASITVTAIGSNGQITGVSILNGGSYTVTPTTLSQTSTSGAGMGATFASPLWGVAAAKMTSAGTYSAVPPSPVAQGSTTGLGAGATFALTWVNNALCIAVPLAAITDYLIAAAAVYEIRATADGYTQVVITGALAVEEGIVR